MTKPPDLRHGLPPPLPMPNGAPLPKAPTIPPSSWTLAQLLQTSFPPPRLVVPDILPVGLAILSGRPKLGKSFLALQLAVAVGSGGQFLGRRCTLGHVLYLAAEDSPLRLQQRLVDMTAPLASDVRFVFAWQPLNGTGTGELRAYIEGFKAHLVVVDTLTRAFTGRLDWDSVGQTTETMGCLQRLALDHDCCILFVDHHRKRTSLENDLIDDIMGSTGKTAVADVVWGLYRQRDKQGATLMITGRDIGDLSLALYFDQALSCWQHEEKDKERPPDLMTSIIHFLRENGQSTTKELARELDRDPAQVNRALARLLARKQVRQGSRQGREVPYILCQ